jgi:formylglycine-generating enzyme required for sulfatase activity
MRFPTAALLSVAALAFCLQTLTSAEPKTSDDPGSDPMTAASGTDILPTDREWALVPTGEYTSGRNNEIRVIGHGYQIMRHCVTNAEYAVFLNEVRGREDIEVTETIVRGGFAGDRYWEAGTYQFLFHGRKACRISYDEGGFSVESGFEDHPVVQVSWFGADAYARHHGWRLPAEEEWEKACRGTTGWHHPWGDTIDGTRANYWNSGDPFDNDTTPVGYYDGTTHGSLTTADSPSPYGAYDMVGNASEWTESYWTETQRTERLNRVVRGGSFQSIKNEITCWGRGDMNPWQGYPHVGFRCAR